MTTIAYRDGIMAADSRMENNGWICGHAISKIVKNPENGDLYAITGDAAVSFKGITQLIAGILPTDLGDGGRVVRLTAAGDLTVFEGAGSFPANCEYTAFGSGYPAALAAMMMGADAITAVKIASAIDPYTGGEIISFKAGLE